MEERIPMTAEGKANLERELAELDARCPGIREAIEVARALGDLRENADYHAAREELGMTEARIRDLKARLSRAYIVGAPQGDADKDMVLFGATVRVFNKKLKKEKTYTLVGPGEDDLVAGRILTTSPIGQALLRKRKGDKVTVVLPAGETQLTVLEVSYA